MVADPYEQMMTYVEDLAQIDWRIVDHALFAVNHAVLQKMVCDYSDLPRTVENTIGAMTLASRGVRTYNNACMWLVHLDSLYQQVANSFNTQKAAEIIVTARDELQRLTHQAITIETLAYAARIGGIWTVLSCQEHS